MSGINSNGIISIDHDELVHIIKRTHEVKTSIFVQGPIGVGKSDSVRRAGKELAKENRDEKGKLAPLEYIETKNPNEHPEAFCVVDIRLAQKDAGEILGLPDNYALLKKDGKYKIIPTRMIETLIRDKSVAFDEIEDYVTRWSMPSWYPRTGKGILFIDEFNLAPPLVQYAMYELINDRCLGDYYLPDGWGVVGAGNRGVLDGSPTFDFPAPLNNRFIWYELKQPTIEKWTEWAMNNGVDYRIIAFLQTKRSALYTFNTKNKEKAFATPRSWTKGSYMIKGVEDESRVMLYLSGVVGTYLAGEFQAFLQARRSLPPTEKFIKNPKTMDIPATDDLLYVLCTNLVEYFMSHKDTKEEGTEVMRSITIFADRIWKQNKKMEFTVFLLKLIKTVDEKFFQKTIITLPEFTDLSVPIKRYLF